MKRLITIFLYCMCMMLWGCPVDSLPASYSVYEPILADRNSLNSLSFASPRPILQAGKVYSYKQYIFINEPDKGYHVIDNSDKTKPTPIGFISILASHDIAIQNDILYSDNATDLISVDISNLRQPKLVKRSINVFPNQAPPDNLPLREEYTPKNRPANTVVIEWRKRS